MAGGLTWDFEDRAAAQGYQTIVGVDEVGRGPLAGPVIAAAYHFKERPEWFSELDDSKKLTSRKRDRLFEQLKNPDVGAWSIAEIEAPEVDILNILQAAMKAMREALGRLPHTPDYALIDGNRMPGEGIHGETIIQGDGKSPSIAAASIIAKVTRDRMMVDYDHHYPGYGFAQHKGYGTREHLEALRNLGPCPIHRHSFAPVSQLEMGF
jgi:ribonuclease HII